MSGSVCHSLAPGTAGLGIPSLVLLRSRGSQIIEAEVSWLLYSHGQKTPPACPKTSQAAAERKGQAFLQPWIGTSGASVPFLSSVAVWNTRTVLYPQGGGYSSIRCSCLLPVPGCVLSRNQCSAHRPLSVASSRKVLETTGSSAVSLGSSLAGRWRALRQGEVLARNTLANKGCFQRRRNYLTRGMLQHFHSPATAGFE